MLVIEKMRLERDWTQKDLAEASNVSLHTVGRIERGGMTTRLTLARIANAFGLPPERGPDLIDTVVRTEPTTGGGPDVAA